MKQAKGLKKQNKFKQFLISNYKILIFAVFVFSISVINGVDRIFISDFIATNGDFQNFNPLRRILDGQIPYVEFANYLGMGLPITTIPFLIFAKSFTASLFITNFTINVMYFVFGAVVIYLSTENKRNAFIGINVLTLVLWWMSRYCLDYDWLRFAFASQLGMSMRTTRAFLTIILVAVFALALKVIKKRSQNISIENIFNNVKYMIVTGLILGSFVLWSNDFGIACTGSALCMIFYMNLIINKKKIKYLFRNIGLVLLGVGVGFLTIITIVTLGHPIQYFSEILQVSKYQFWYYNGLIWHDKILQISQILSNPIILTYLIVFIVEMVYLLRKIYKNKDNWNYIGLAFINLSTFLATALYIYGSGGLMYEAFSYSVFLILIGFIINKIEILCHKKMPLAKVGKVYIAVSLCFCLILAYEAYPAAKRYLRQSRGDIYVEELQGYVPDASSLRHLDEVIGEEKIFSTYASALEVVLGQFQPTGIDYIIHVLGDETRQEYVDEFLEGDYKYATTIRKDYYKLNWENWIWKANWFWYEHLYEWYQPVDYSGYNVLWEKVDESKALDDVKADVKIVKTSDVCTEIVVETDCKDDIIVGVKVNYDNEYVLNPQRFQTFNKIVRVTGGVLSYYIPNNDTTYSIPIEVKDGYGSVELTSYPENCTKLEVSSVEVEKVLPDPTKFALKLTSGVKAERLTDDYWDHGINVADSKIILENDEQNQYCLENAKALVTIDDIKKEILSVDFVGDYIEVTFEDSTNLEFFTHDYKLSIEE